MSDEPKIGYGRFDPNPQPLTAGQQKILGALEALPHYRADSADLATLRAQLADALRERDEYERLLDFAADKGARLLGERDAALANVAVLRDALLVAARSAEALKRECGMDPESPQAVRNSEYMNISYAARNALEKTR